MEDYRLELRRQPIFQDSASIYMAPTVLRDPNPSCFTPRVVSIGPLHRDNEKLKAFEPQKTSYIKSLMVLIGKTQDEIMKECMKNEYISLDRIRKCYVLPRTYGDAEIAEIMVRDACFILEFIFQVKQARYDKRHTKHMLLRVTVLHDLLLLENQIPFFFLEKIHELTISTLTPKVSLLSLISPVLKIYDPFNGVIDTENIFTDTTHHILSLLHQCYKPQGVECEDKKVLGLTTISSAVDLDRAGVTFKPNKDLTWVLAMKVKSQKFPCIFGSWSKPNFHMPVFRVKDFTELVLRNLIAYEQSNETCNYVTSYVATMDMLVDTQEDVAKLVDSKVMINTMGSHKKAADMINSICKNTHMENSAYEKQFEILNNHCNSYWPRNIAKMRSTYFSSPWSMIALLAGIILFALTVVQTIFTVNPPGN